MSLFKTNLTATNLNVTKLTITTMNEASTVLASNTDIIDTGINNKMVTPASLKYLLENPSSIGSVAPSSAIFTTLNCTDLSGDCVANDTEAIAMGQIAKVITPMQLRTILYNPPVIGSGISNTGTFTNIRLNSISGCIADQNQITNDTVNDRILTPITISSILQNPPTIGSSSVSNAKFTNLKIKGTLELSSDTLDSSMGGTGLSSYTKGDILVGTAGGSLAKLAVGDDGTYLQTDSSATYGIKWDEFSTGSSLSSGATQINPASNAEAINSSITNKALVPSNTPSIFASFPEIGSVTPNTAKFTNLTATNLTSKIAIPINKGGLGTNIFTKGDLLLGSVSNGLTRLNAGTNNQVLVTDNLGNIRWNDQPVAAGGGSSSIPTGYADLSMPVLSSGTSYTISKVIAKSYDGTSTINLADVSFDLTTAVVKSAALTGTISTSGIDVTGSSTTFTTDFIVGDVLYVDTVGGRRIVSITSDTSLTLESAFGDDQSDVAYKRGGFGDNTNYYCYAGSSTINFSTRNYENNDTVLDLSGSIDTWFQSPLQFRCITSNPIAIGPFLNASLCYPAKYINCKEPVYYDSTGYTIKSCNVRNEKDNFNIDVTTSQLVTISRFGQNALESEVQLTGTISTIGNLVTGSGTSFTTELAVGDIIGLSGGSRTAKVTAINSNTSLILDRCIDSGTPDVPNSSTVYGDVTWTMNGLCLITSSDKKYGSNSLYIDGASNQNYLATSGLPYTTPSKWTLEAWIKLPSTQTNYLFGNYGSNTLQFWYSATQMGLVIQYEGNNNDKSITASTSISLNTWYHIAWVYDGSTYRLYFNGTLVTSSIAGNIKNGTFSDLIVGSKYPLGNIYNADGSISYTNKYTTGYKGYIDEVRFSNVARYTSATYTIPAAGFEIDYKTIFLQNFEGLTGLVNTNGVLSALDDTSAVYTTSGALAISSTSKFGSGSLRFIRDGLGKVTIGTFPSTSSAWTIECWFYLNSLQVINPIIAQQTANLFAVYVNDFGVISYRLSSNGTSFNLLDVKESGITINTWYHMAIVFTGTQYLAFLNGIMVGYSVTSTAINASAWSTTFGLGCYNSIYLDGMVDEFRFSSSARYTNPLDSIPTTLVDEVDGVTWTQAGSRTYSTTSKFGTTSANITAPDSYTITTALRLGDGLPQSAFPSGLGVWYDASDSGTITTSGSNITQVADKSGNGRNIVPSTGGTAAPTYVSSIINSKNVIRFSGDGCKSLVGTGIGDVTSWSGFFVLRYLGDGYLPILMMTDGGWASGSTLVGGYPSTTINLGMNAAGSNVTSAFSPSHNTTYILSVIDAGTSVSMYINGNAIVTNNTNLNNGVARRFSTIGVGGWQVSPNRSYYGYMGELQMYTGALGTTDRQAVENYMMYKWGVTGTVYGYPYDNTPIPWTLECWFYPTTTGITNTIIGHSNNASDNIINIAVNTDDAVIFQLSSNASTFNLLNVSTSNGAITANTWYHVAVVCDLSNYYAFLNGTLVGSNASSTVLYTTAFLNGYLSVGKFKTNTSTGYIDEFRLSKVARYTSGFTPSANAFTEDADTISLQHFDRLVYNYMQSLVDSADENITWSRFGGVTLSDTIYKFGSKSANVTDSGGYSVATTLLPYTLATIDSSSASNFPSGLSLWLDASDLSSLTLAGSTVTQWNDKSGNARHAVRSSNGTTSPVKTTAINNLTTVQFAGSTHKCMYSAGPGAVSSYTSFIVFKCSTLQSGMYIYMTDGAWASSNVYLALSSTTGFVYFVHNTGGFTVTNIPPVNNGVYLISIVDDSYGSYIYINGIFAGVSANSISIATRNLTTLDIGGWNANVNNTFNGHIGEFQVYNRTLNNTERASVEQYLMAKWGLITGTAGSGPWTVETWFRCTTLGVTNPIISNYYGTGNTTNILNIGVNSSNNIVFQASSNGNNWDLLDITGSDIIALDTWYHVAMSYDGTDYYGFLNGALVGSNTSNLSLNMHAFKTLTVGIFQTTSFTGYIDEFRLSKVARYTSTFTPSSIAFVTDSNTISLQHFTELVTVDPSFTVATEAFTSDGSTSYLNHFNLSQNYNTTEKTLVTTSNQDYYYRTLAPDTIYYLYVYGGNTPYYILSPRCYTKTDSPPKWGSTNFRQLPYVFITNSSGSLYHIEWDDYQANFVNPPDFTLVNNSATYSSSYVSTLDMNKIIPKTSKLAMIAIRNMNGGAITSVLLRDTFTRGYGYIQCATNTSGQTIQQTVFAPLDSDQKSYMEKTGNNANMEYQVVGFYINDLE